MALRLAEYPLLSLQYIFWNYSFFKKCKLPYTVQGNEIFLDAIQNTRVGKKSGIKIWSSVTEWRMEAWV